MTDQLWLEFKGTSGPGLGKHIVLVSGDEEYRSEEALPMMGKVLSTHHGFDCTVLFAIDPETGEIDPEHQTNIPGLEALDSADLMLIFTPLSGTARRADEAHCRLHQFGVARSWGSERQRTPFSTAATPAARMPSTTARTRISRVVSVVRFLGDTWVTHHGHHGYESTRALINPASKDHPILKGVTDVWGTTDVYAVGELTGNPQVLLDGQVLVGMNHDDDPKPDTPTMPIAWIKEYTGDEGKASQVFCTTMGAATDLRSDDLRRLLVNVAYWGMRHGGQHRPESQCRDGGAL